MIDIADLTEEQARKELEQIAAEMAKSDIAYYQNDNPYLTDAEYDALKRRNEQIEQRFPQLVRTNSPSQKVGAPLLSAFKKCRTVFPCSRLAMSSVRKKWLTLS